MIREIVKYPDQFLRKKCQAISHITSDLIKLADDMLETMYKFKGIGLAAPQVGELTQLVIVDTVWPYKAGGTQKYIQTDLEKSYKNPLVLFNPKVTKLEGKTAFNEGCLSVPGYFEDVPRSNYVEVKGIDKNEKEIVIKTDGLLSICLQHEIDHLEGIMFIDRLSLIKSTRLRAKIKKYGYDEIPNPEGHDVL
ncbi:MAG: peptide deformylase [Pseudomonadota bacterium]|nr:peptide deformylase [Pseudomonadota bacterium]